jgi:hypothetical protein
MAKPDKKKKSNVLSLDFEGVEGRVTLPEGDYRVHFSEASKEEGSGDHDYVEWKLRVTEGKFEDKIIYNRTSLSPKALWNMRNMLEAANVEVPDGPLDIDLDTVDELGDDFMVTVVHEDYEGKPQMRVVDYFPVGDDETPATETKADKGKAGKAAEPEPEDEAPDFESMDEDELEAFIDENDLDVDLDDHKKLKAKREAVAEAWAEKSTEGGDAGGGGTEYDEDAINEMGTKELADIVKKAKLNIELDGSTKTKRRAVIKALKAKKLL